MGAPRAALLGDVPSLPPPISTPRTSSRHPSNEVWSRMPRAPAPRSSPPAPGRCGSRPSAPTPPRATACCSAAPTSPSSATRRCTATSTPRLSCPRPWRWRGPRTAAVLGRQRPERCIRAFDAFPKLRRADRELFRESDNTQCEHPRRRHHRAVPTHGAVFAISRPTRARGAPLRRQTLGVAFAEDVTSETFLVAFARRASFTVASTRARGPRYRHRPDAEALAPRGPGLARKCSRPTSRECTSTTSRPPRSGWMPMDSPRTSAPRSPTCHAATVTCCCSYVRRPRLCGDRRSLDIPLGTVRSRLSRARRKVRAAITPHITPAPSREREHHRG